MGKRIREDDPSSQATETGGISRGMVVGYADRDALNEHFSRLDHPPRHFVMEVLTGRSPYIEGRHAGTVFAWPAVLELVQKKGGGEVDAARRYKAVLESYRDGGYNLVPHPDGASFGIVALPQPDIEERSEPEHEGGLVLNPRVFDKRRPQGGKARARQALTGRPPDAYEVGIKSIYV
jgi:hypothetical protein